jgi:hypothetical protein
MGGDVRIRRIDRVQGAWIGYQLKLRGITQMDIGRRAGVTDVMVNRVIYGVRTSARVQKIVAETLGFVSWQELRAACERSKKGAAA